MRRILFILLFAPLLSLAQNDTVHLVWLVGESNIAGMAPNSAATAGELATRSNLKIWNNSTNAFESLLIGTNNNINQNVSAGTHGLELYAANAAAGAGATLNWIDGALSWAALNSNGSSNLISTGLYKQNGRYLLSFRGGGTSTLDVYDIAANTWLNALPYGFQTETFTTGSSSCDFKGNVYIQKEATGRVFRFSVDEWSLQSLAQHIWVQGATVTGNKMMLLIFNDGSDLPILFTLGHTTTDLYRLMVI